MNLRRTIIRAAGVALTAGTAPWAPAQQPPPFFGGGVAAYDPIPATVWSGALLDAQAVVSSDRRYVTINAQPTNTHLLALNRFPVVSATPQGFVGGVVFPAGQEGAPSAAGGAGGSTGGGTASADERTRAAKAFVTPSPGLIDRAAQSWILTRQGMYLVKPLD